MEQDNPQTPLTKIDLHVHSRFSKRASQWVLQKIGCPESFTEPRQVYETARKKGMDLVTITDHNTISGALEIAHLPGTFVSEEITTYFPDNRCKVHVLAYDITEAQHLDIQKARENIFDLAGYLYRENIFHVLAHPLYSINDRLTLDHFEKLLLIFKTFEINGARDANQSQCLQAVLSSLTPERMALLSDRHGIDPTGAFPWQKYLTGGSDDHSGLNICRTHTEICSLADVKSALDALQTGQARVVVGHASTPLTLAHNLYGIAYQFYRSKFNLERYTERDVLMRFLDRSLSMPPENEPGILSRIYFYWNYRKAPKMEADISENLMDMIRRETRNLIHDNPDMLNDGPEQAEQMDAPELKWFDFVNRISSKVLNGFANHLFGHLSGGNVFSIFHVVGSAGGLYTLLAPYFVSFSHFTRDRAFIQEVRAQLTDDSMTETVDLSEIRVAHFTDTFYEVNGVARTLNQQIEIAQKKHKQLTIITCDAEDRIERQGVKNFKPVGVHELPEYPDQKIFYPPILEMLHYCYDRGITHIHSATPGPIGLAALAIANILKLPIDGTYHTALPQYAQYLTGDNAIEELTWKYTLWYYGQMNRVYAPSKSTADELIEKGILADRIRLMERGIDITLFHPSKRNGFFKKHCQIDDQIIKLLYVGRVSREKNLPILVEAFNRLSGERPDVHLVIVGEGPYLEEMKTELSEKPVTFTGYLAGEDLAAAYASSNVFVFPSTTDTFGNVVLEAQASGIPVIVTDQGGPQENLIPSRTGFIARGNDTDSFLESIRLLVNDVQMAGRMGLAARKYMEERTFEKAFLKTWEMYEPAGFLTNAMAVNA
ncbi:MAG: glycosyltransferase [Deltaproteobacteria bacterium]|nr:glycosyltransferase [Deltaproteobacteria bacterium]